MGIHWPTIIASGLASFVEFVEALTIVLAVGVVRGWKSAFVGAATAAIALTLLVLLFGPQLAHFKGEIFKVIIGTLLLLFGLRWLRKAILRAGGAMKLHNEDEAFKEEVAVLKSTNPVLHGLDFGAAMVAFHGVFIEGFEVVFIVIAVGSAQHLIGQASFGAAIAAVSVIILGFIARKPLSQIPENLLKFAVGILVSSFGTFWVGEGLNVPWAGGDFSLLLISLTYLLVGIIGVQMVKNPSIGQASRMEVK